jgi:hypothetical protein
MAAEKAFGEGQHGKLDALTVSDVAPRCADRAAVRAVGSHRALRLAAVPVPATEAAGNSPGAELDRRPRRADHVQRRVDDVEVPQREPRSSTRRS